MDSFVSRLRSDRKKAGLTVRQLADRSRISFSYISKIETGRTRSGISPQIVATLAKELGCDELEYLPACRRPPTDHQATESGQRGFHLLAVE